MTSAFAIVFPGQGAQKIGMLAELANQYPSIKETFAQASEALHYDMWQLAQMGPETQLNLTQYTQPLLLTAGVSLWRLWLLLQGAKPVVLAGHSLGEYTALTCAGVLDLASAVQLVAIRGQAMQEAVPEGFGAMAAIVGLSDAVVAEICELASLGDVLSPANYNTPGQVAVAGTSAAVERVLTLAKERGAKLAKLLAVSVPAHCALMGPAVEKLKAAMANITFQSPQIPVINNVDVAIEMQPSVIQQALLRQLCSPVRWVETMTKIASMGSTAVLDGGPGQVLAGMTKRIDKDLLALSLDMPSTLQAALKVTSV